MLVGDDQELLREVEALAVERLGCKLFTGHEAYETSSHVQGTLNGMQDDQRCRALLIMLMDMELLAHTDYFVGACPAAVCCCHNLTALLLDLVNARDRRQLMHTGCCGLVVIASAYAGSRFKMQMHGRNRSINYLCRAQCCSQAAAARATVCAWCCAAQPNLTVLSSAGSFTSSLAQLVDKMRYILYGKHRRTTIDAVCRCVYPT